MNTCNKIQYSSKKDANASAKVCLNNNKTGIKLTAYKCTNCSFWHMTSLSKRDSKKVGKSNAEVYRRLSIVKKLNDSPLMATVDKLKENWMVLNNENKTLVCTVGGKIKVVNLIG